MNITALIRLIGYLLAVGLGVFMAVWGVIHGDPALTATGVALATTGGIAGANTPVRPAGDHAAD